MRKLATIVAAAASIAVAAICLPILAVAALAQDATMILADASPWSAFWSAIQAPLVVFATAILTAFGSVVTFYARRYFGEGAALAANQTYRIAMEAAAGWLAAKLHGGKQVDDSALQGALDYALISYPEIESIEPSIATIREDIVAAFGRLKAKG